MKSMVEMSEQEVADLAGKLHKFLPPGCLFALFLGDADNFRGTFSNLNPDDLPDMLREMADQIEQQTTESN